MDPHIVTAFVDHVEDSRLIIDYAYVATAALVAYDYALTLHLEVTLVWCSAWNYTNVLFLLNRYLPILESILFIYNQAWLDVSPNTCQYLFRANTWIILMSMTLAEIVLALRTWAIWHRSFIVGLLLSAMIIASIPVQCALLVKFGNTLSFAPPPYPGYRGCFVTSASEVLIWNYIIFIVLEAVVLTLMGFSAFRAYLANKNSKLLRMVHRDGILFYVYLLCVSIANVITIKNSPLDLVGLFSPMEAVIYSILTCRIILNIRRTARHHSPETFELHTQDPRVEEEESVTLSTLIHVTTTDWWE